MIRISKLMKAAAEFARTHRREALDDLTAHELDDNELVVSYAFGSRGTVGDLLQMIDEGLSDEEKPVMVSLAQDAGFDISALKELAAEIGTTVSWGEWRVDVFYLTGNSATFTSNDRDAVCVWAGRWQACGAKAFLMHKSNVCDLYDIEKQLF